MKNEDVTKTQEDLHKMVKFWSKEEQGFKIAGKVHKITGADVERLFGLPCKGLTPKVDGQSSRPENSRFFDKYFPQKKPVTHTQLKTALMMAIADQKAEDIAVLLVLELCATFFFTNTCSSISFSLMKLCANLGAMKNYGWAEMVNRSMKSGLNEGFKQLSGCIPLIMYWIADRIKIAPKVAE